MDCNEDKTPSKNGIEFSDCTSAASGRRTRPKHSRRQWQHRNMATFAKRLTAVMEERGSLSSAPEAGETCGEQSRTDPPDEYGENGENTVFSRVRSLSAMAATSISAFAAWVSEPDESAATTFQQQLSRSSSDSETETVPTPGSRHSFSSTSESTISFLGDALLRAREENGNHASPDRREQSYCSYPMGIA
mmetsp:Transcript_45099/g.105181  ORF Transcript_45099/g.105181 Transcript_45099/m.105181 type:complete len:191 (+) Transcript_45099:91-663(+)